jgi:hypothetical protein
MFRSVAVDKIVISVKLMYQDQCKIYASRSLSDAPVPQFPGVVEFDHWSEERN